MKKKIILAITLGIILFIGLWALVYFPLKNYQVRIQNEAFFQDAHDYLISDSYFANQYGTIVSVELYQEQDVQFVESGIWRIPCEVTVELGKTYYVLVEVNYHNGSFSYIEVKENPS